MDTISWLMDGDPAIRWQVSRDPLDSSDLGKPSRWNTLRAMWVLRHVGGS